MQEPKNKLLIDGSISQEIRIAIVNEQNNLIEYSAIGEEKSILGNIYLGFIEKVEPSINVAFVNFGQDNSGFLSFTDIHSDYYKRNGRRNHIKNSLKKGAPVIVQVVREPMGTKSATLTTYIALTGKNCVFFPKDSTNSGISKQISGENRARLKEFLSTLEPNVSLIIRTASLAADITEIKADYKRLKKIWHQIEQETKNKNNPILLLEEDQFLKKLRSYSKHSVNSVTVESKSIYDRIKGYIAKNIIHFPPITQGKNIFQHIETQISALYSKQVELPAGGAIVIEQTEALTAIDINSRNSLKEKNIEETAFKTNMEAADECVKQIMLRNIGGLIIIDFIDMENEENIKTLNKTIKAAFKSDKAANTIIGYSPLGIVQISRQRLNTNFNQLNFTQCNMCKGTGRNLKNDAAIYMLLRNIKQAHINKRKIRIYTSAQILQAILNNFSQYLYKEMHLQWEIVAENHNMYNKIETIK